MTNIGESGPIECPAILIGMVVTFMNQPVRRRGHLGNGAHRGVGRAGLARLDVAVPALVAPEWHEGRPGGRRRRRTTGRRRPSPMRSGDTRQRATCGQEHRRVRLARADLVRVEDLVDQRRPAPSASTFDRCTAGSPLVSTATRHDAARQRNGLT